MHRAARVAHRGYRVVARPVPAARLLSVTPLQATPTNVPPPAAGAGSSTSSSGASSTAAGRLPAPVAAAASAVEHTVGILAGAARVMRSTAEHTASAAMRAVPGFPPSFKPAAACAPAASTPSAPADTSDIKFYERDAPHFEFANFYERPIQVDGVTWPTTEHYFQVPPVRASQALAVLTHTSFVALCVGSEVRGRSGPCGGRAQVADGS